MKSSYPCYVDSALSGDIISFYSEYTVRITRSDVVFHLRAASPWIISVRSLDG